MSVNVFLKYIGIFVIFVLLQVLLFNNISLSGLGITPFFYILFILILPFNISGWVLLLFAFFLGLTIDVFSDTSGVHASATVFIAFIRPTVLRVISGRDGYSPETSPGIAWYGFTWFFKYTVILSLIHHLVYFLILEFSFIGFSINFYKAFLTALLTSVIIFISQYLFFKK